MCKICFSCWSFLLFFATLVGQGLQWEAPIAISASGVDASSPLVGVDGSGNVVAVWLENGVVKAKNLPLSGSWSSASTLSGAGASSHKLVVAPNGNATVIWIQGGALMASSRPAGESWSSSVTLSGLGTAASPDLAVDTSGNVIAVWVQTSLTLVVTIQSSTKLNGGNWQALPDTISTGTSSPSSPTVAIGSAGHVCSIWHALSGTNDVLFSAKKTISSGGWGTPAGMFAVSAAYRHNYPRVAVDATGNAYAVWFRYALFGSAYGTVDTLASFLPSGSSTWLAIPLGLSERCSQRNPADFYLRLLIDEGNNILAFWTASRYGDTFDVRSALLTYGKTWSVGGGVTTGELYAWAADAAINSSGGVVGVYTSDAGGTTIIKAAECDIQNELYFYWGPSNTISQGGQNGYPRVGIGTAGSSIVACAVWVHNDGTDSVIHAAVGTKNTVLPPTNLSVVQNSQDYGAFLEYYNTVSWQESADPNLVGYLIYRNGTFVTFLEPTALEFVDHNAVQNGSVVYGVAAYNSSNLQSSIANVNFP